MPGNPLEKREGRARMAAPGSWVSRGDDPMPRQKDFLLPSRILLILPTVPNSVPSPGFLGRFHSLTLPSKGA